jgi:hypothetical protein
MSLTPRIEALVDGGHYKEALDALKSESSLPESLAATRLFLNSHLSDLKKAQSAAEVMLRRSVEARTLAICKEIVGRSLLVHGDRPSEGLRLSEEARDAAKASLGLVAYARYSADHVAILLHRIGINEATAQIQPLRKLVLASGDLRALTLTHLIQAEIRIKQGHLARALRDLNIVEDLLSRQPHVVLDGRRALAAAAIESSDGTLPNARRLAEYAVKCADVSGSITLRIPALGT